MRVMRGIMCNHLDLTEWSGIVVASGDGLVYEVNRWAKSLI